MKQTYYSIAPKGTLDHVKRSASYVTKNKPAVVKGRAGGTISLISQSPQSLVSTSGLKWNLTDCMLSWGGKISQSNEFSSDISEISELLNKISVKVVLEPLN